MQAWSRRMQVIAAALFLLLGLLFAGTWWVLSSDAALSRALATLVQQSGGKLEIEGVSGSLRDRVRIQRLRWHDEKLTVTAEQIELLWSPWALSGRRLQIDEVVAQQVRVTTISSQDIPLLPATLALPIAVDIEQLKVVRLEVLNGDPNQLPLQFSDLQLRYSGDAARHRLRQASVTTPFGSVQAELDLAAQRPFALSGQIGYRYVVSPQDLAAQGVLEGSLANIGLRLNGQAGSTQLKGQARIQPFEAAWLPGLQIDSSDVDLATMNPAWPQTRLQIGLNVSTSPTGQLSGTLQSSNVLTGPLSEQRLPLSTLRAKFQLNERLLEWNSLQLMLGQKGNVTGSGVLDLATMQSNWQLALREIDLRSLHASLRTTRLAGSIKAQAGPEHNEVLADMAEQGMRMALDLTWRGDEIELRQLQARAGAGRLNGQGHLSLAGQRAFSFKLNSARLDPAAFGRFPTASINAEAQASGSLGSAEAGTNAGAGWAADVRFKIADSSTLSADQQRLPLAGQGKLQLSAGQAHDVSLQLRLGDNRLQAQGNWGRPRDQVDFKLDAPKLAQLGPAFGGALNASGNLSGTTAAPIIRTQLQGSNLRYGEDYHLSDMAGDVTLSSDVRQSLLVKLEAKGLVTPQIRMAQSSLKVDGTLMQHEIEFGSSNPAKPRLDLKARLRGSWQKPTVKEGIWRGQMLALDQQGDIPIQLLAPVTLELSSSRLHVGGAALSVVQADSTGGAGRINLGELNWEQWQQAGLKSGLNTSGTFSGIPAAILLTLADAQVEDLQSSLRLGGQWLLNTTPRLNGSLKVARESGDLMLLRNGTSDGTSAGLTQLELQMQWINDALDARLKAAASRIGTVAAELRSTPPATAEPGTFALNAPAILTAQLDVASLRPLALLSGTSAVLDGKLRMTLSGTGPLNALKLSGRVEGEGLRLEAPQYGMLYKEGRVRAELLDDRLQIQEFSISGGEGKLSMSGGMNLRSFLSTDQNTLISADATNTLTWKAERFRALQRPDARLILDGNGTLAWAGDHIQFNGQARATEAYFELPDRSNVRLGNDVVVKGRTGKAGTSSRRAVPLRLDLEFDLGPRFAVVGQGLDARLEGQVKIRSTADGTLLAYGRIASANGSYQALGQKLNIERGLIYFDGPINNPALDLLALRKNQPVEAGVQITGTAQVPQVQLVSEPAVPDGEKLSWLILGRGLDGISSADTGTLQAAARLLYGATAGASSGPSLTDQFANSLGLDEIGLQGRASGGEGQVVAFGKRLSDRVYLAYEQGLTVAGNALRIEYVLTRFITLRAEAGQVNSFGIYFNRSYP